MIVLTLYLFISLESTTPAFASTNIENNVPQLDDLSTSLECSYYSLKFTISYEEMLFCLPGF